MRPKRRVAGEGSVFRRKSDGLWIGQCYVDGRKRRVYGKSQADATSRLLKLLHDRETGVLADPTQDTVAAFLDRWMRDVVRPTRRPNTVTSYEGIINGHIAPVIGKVKLSRLGPAQVQRLLVALREREAGARTIQLAYDVLQAALGQAQAWRLVTVKATDAVKRPRAPRQPIHPLTADQAAALLRQARGASLEALLTTALTTGLRFGELAGLQWRCVDLAAGLLRVERQLQRTRKGQPAALVDPKTTASRRTVEFPDVTVHALRSHRARQAAARLRRGPEWSDLDLVFTERRHGGPLSGSNVTRAFRRLLRQARLPLVRFHDLRHTHASLLLAEGVNPRTVADRLGHTNVAFMLSVYAHTLPRAGRSAADKIGTLLAG